MKLIRLLVCMTLPCIVACGDDPPLFFPASDVVTDTASDTASDTVSDDTALDAPDTGDSSTGTDAGDATDEDATTDSTPDTPAVPRIFVTPNPINFGRVPAGISRQLSATITSIGGEDLVITDFFIVGGSGAFSIDDDTAFGVLADGGELVIEPDDSVEVQIDYLPPDGEFDTARFIIQSNDPTTADGDFIVELQGNGAEPCIEVIPTSVDFGVQPLELEAVQEVVVRNCSDPTFGGALDITSLALRDDSDGAYALGPTVPDTPLSLAPGEEEPLDVSFTPVESGPREGWLVIESNDRFEPELTVNLAGSGTDGTCTPPTARAGCSIAESGRPPASEVFAPRLANLVCTAEGSEAGVEPITWYEWSVVEAPPGSTSTVFPPGEIEGTFFADVVGRYTLQLSIGDDIGCEDSALVTILARPDEDMFFELVWTTPADPDETDTGFGAGTDLDIHLLHPNGCWEDTTWDCHFRNANPNWGDPARTDDDPSLVIDDTDGAGPEAIAYDNPESGRTFTVAVNSYNDHGYGPSTATVRTYIFGELVHEAESEVFDGQWWVVATVDWPSTTIDSVDLTFNDVPPCD